jgi:hypothetical protein
MAILDAMAGLAGGLLGAGVAGVAFRGLAQGWFALQLERFRADQMKGLEEVKAELGLVKRLQGGIAEKRARSCLPGFGLKPSVPRRPTMYHQPGRLRDREGR